MKLGKLASPQFKAAMKSLMSVRGASANVAFRIRGIAKKIQTEVDKYEELKTEFIQEYSEKNEDGTVKIETMAGQSMIKFPPGKLQEFNKKVTELSEIDIELPPIRVDELPDLAAFSLEDIYQLEFIVD